MKSEFPPPSRDLLRRLSMVSGPSLRYMTLRHHYRVTSVNHLNIDELRELPIVINPGPLFRVHRHDHRPTYFGNRSILRFDPPVDRQADFGTFYGATSPAAALLETLGSIRPLPGHLVKERMITNLLVGGEFIIADLTEKSVISIYGDLSASMDFRLTQAWAAALWDAGFRGVQYFTSYRQCSGEFAIALFGPPGVQDHLLKSNEPERIGPSLLSEVKDRFDIDVLDRTPLPW